MSRKGASRLFSAKTLEGMLSDACGYDKDLAPFRSLLCKGSKETRLERCLAYLEGQSIDSILNINIAPKKTGPRAPKKSVAEEAAEEQEEEEEGSDGECPSDTSVQRKQRRCGLLSPRTVIVIDDD